MCACLLERRIFIFNPYRSLGRSSQQVSARSRATAYPEKQKRTEKENSCHHKLGKELKASTIRNATIYGWDFKLFTQSSSSPKASRTTNSPNSILSPWMEDSWYDGRGRCNGRFNWRFDGLAVFNCGTEIFWCSTDDSGVFLVSGALQFSVLFVKEKLNSTIGHIPILGT